MKVVVTMKDPDTLTECVEEAVRKLTQPHGITASEWREIKAQRAEEISHAISSAFMRYGEYLDVEFDVPGADDAPRPVTATVLPAKD